MMLTKDEILQTNDLTTEHVEVPEWDGAVWVRTMTGTERDAFEASMAGKGDDIEARLTNIRAKLCVRCICTESGERVFADEDEVALGKKGARPLDRIFAVAQRLNAVSDDDVEALAKN